MLYADDTSAQYIAANNLAKTALSSGKLALCDNSIPF